MPDNQNPDRDWNLSAVGAQEAWKILDPTTGDPRNIDWEGVDIGQIDTGYTEHPVFGNWASGDVWLRAGEGVNYLEPGQLPKDPLQDGFLLFPGHGTRIGSVICGDASSYQPSFNMGVAPRLPVTPYRVTNTVFLSGSERRERVAKALLNAVERNYDVISISLGWPWVNFLSTRRMGKAVDKAYDQGMIVVAAGGQGIDTVVFPGKFWRTIGVGGVAFSGRLYQHYRDANEYIDVWAPATDIYRASARRPDAVDIYEINISADDTTADFSDSGALTAASGSASSGNLTGDGTSYATAHVSAAAAMWFHHRGADIERLYGQDPTKRWQIVEAFRQVVKASSRELTDPRRPTNGSGYLNIPALLSEQLPDPDHLQKQPPAANQFA